MRLINNTPIEHIHKIYMHIWYACIDTLFPSKSEIHIWETFGQKQHTLFSCDNSCDDIFKKSKRPDALFTYKADPLHLLFPEIKTRKNTRIMRLIAHYAHKELQRTYNEPRHVYIFIPIPMTHRARVSRGYNQVELLAHYICALSHNALRTHNTSLPHDTPQYRMNTRVLHKHRNTADQVGKNRKERQENLKDCFSVHTRHVHSLEKKYSNIPHTYIIIDDIVTTGTTLCEAKKTLSKAIKTNIHSIAIAG